MIVSAIMLSGLILACVDTANKSSKAEEEIAFEELAVSIEQYNEYFYQNFGIDPETRAKKKKTDWGLVVGADATGALMGSFFWLFSLIAAIAASTAAAVTSDAPNPNSAPTINSMAYYTQANSYYEVLIGKDDYDRLGVEHNNIINTIYDSCNRYTSNAELMEIVLLALEDDGYDTSEIRDNYDYYFSCIDGIITQIKTPDFASVMPQYPARPRHEIQMIEDYVSFLEIIDPDDRVEYTIGFRDNVISSNIPDSSKTAIRSGISVALASAELWNIPE